MNPNEPANAYAVSEGSQQATASVDLVYAGAWRRAAAIGIDYILVAVCVRLALPYFGPLLLQMLGAGVLLAPVILWWLFYAMFESSEAQGSPGKIAVGIKVVDQEGWPISFGRASGRFFARFMSLLSVFGYPMAFLTQQKITLHDMVAKTLVVHRAVPKGTLQAIDRSEKEGTGWMVVGLLLLAAIPAVILLPEFVRPPQRGAPVARAGITPRVEREATKPRAATSPDELRAEVRETLAELAPVRRAVERYYAKHREWPYNIDDLSGIDEKPSARGYVYITANGTVVLAFNDTAPYELRFTNLATHPRAKPNGSFTWRCDPFVPASQRGSPEARINTTLPPELVPANCG